MDTTRLQALLFVADLGSIARAAEALGTSRATVSRRLDELEKEVGAPLFTSEAGGTRLTAGGQRLVRRGRSLHARSQALESLFRAPDLLTGDYVVAIPTGIPPEVGGAIARGFSRFLPRSRFRVLSTDDPVRELREGADFAMQFGPVTEEGPWRTSVVNRMPERLIASRAYLAREGTPGSLDDLERHRLMVWEGPNGPTDRLPLLKGGTFEVQPWSSCTDGWLLTHAAARGAGIAFAPTGPLPRALRESLDLVQVLPDQIGRDCTMQILIPDRWITLPRIRPILALIRARIRSL